MSETSEIETQAALWVVQLDDRDCTDQRRAEFTEWVARDPRHKRAFDDVKCAWDRCSILGAADAMAARIFRIQ